MWRTDQPVVPWRRLQRAPVLGVALLLSVAAVARVVLTYSVFSQAFDEPAHIATGMEWPERGMYTLENCICPWPV